MNKEDQSKEEVHLYNIISACELILDDMEHGASMNQGDFNNLGYADGIVQKIQKNISKEVKPSNIKGGHYPVDGSFAPMTDRIYSDDEHGNAL